jgi:hypothetical protein
VSLKEKTSVKQVMKSGIIHSSGLGERHSSGYNVNELLLLSIDKGLTFHTSEKGNNTISNFNCYTGKIPIRSRQEEGRVRKILNLAYVEFDKAIKRCQV